MKQDENQRNINETRPERGLQTVLGAWKTSYLSPAFAAARNSRGGQLEGPPPRVEAFRPIWPMKPFRIQA